MTKSAVKVNNVKSQLYFSNGNIIYVTHITPLEAVLLFIMLLVCNLCIQLGDYISNLNN